MADDEQQVNQGEIAAINAMNKAHDAQTSWLTGNDITDRLHEHEQRLAAEADNDEEETS